VQQIFTFSSAYAIIAQMKWGKQKRPPQVVTITKETPSRQKPDRFFVMKRGILLVLSVMAVVLSVNAATNLITSHAVSLYAANTWDGVIGNDTFKVRAGNRVNLPIPERFEHTFAGWYRDAEFTKPFNPTKDRIHKNTTLHARFTRNEYTITLIDPRFYFEPDYTPQIFTRQVGTHFIFPGEPQVPAGMTAPDCGTFQGWSLSMHLEPPDNLGTEHIIAPAPGGTRIANFFRQNATYWAAWDNLPLPEYETATRHIDVHFVTDAPISERIDTFLLGYELTTDPMPYSFYRQLGFNMRIPLTMPSMFYTTDDDQHAYFTVLNDGMTSYRFGGWRLLNDLDYNVYLDGESVHLGPLADFINGGRLTFHAVWLEY